MATISQTAPAGNSANTPLLPKAQLKFNRLWSIESGNNLFPLSSTLTTQKTVSVFQRILALVLDLITLPVRAVMLLMKAIHVQLSPKASPTPTLVNTNNQKLADSSVLKELLNDVPVLPKVDLTEMLKALNEESIAQNPKTPPELTEAEKQEAAHRTEVLEAYKAALVRITNLANQEMEAVRNLYGDRNAPLPFTGPEFEQVLVHQRHLLNVLSNLDTQALNAGPYSIEGIGPTFGGYQVKPSAEGEVSVPFFEQRTKLTVGPSLAVDIISAQVNAEGNLQTLAIGQRRAGGGFALAGGFVDESFDHETRTFALENNQTAARRELQEEMSTTNLEQVERVGFFADPERDFRGVTSEAFFSTTQQTPKAGDDLHSTFLLSPAQLLLVLAHETRVWSRYEAATDSAQRKAVMKDSLLFADHGRILCTAAAGTSLGSLLSKAKESIDWTQYHTAQASA